MNAQPRLQPVHSARVAAPKSLNQYHSQSIADRCLIHGASRWTVAREYGINRREVDEICDQAMFERGRRVERVAAKFRPPMDFAYKG